MRSNKKLFAVIAVDDNDKVGQIIASAFPESYLLVEPGQWLIAGDSTMTTTELSQKLHITDETDDGPEDGVAAGIVLSISNYYGRASKSTWEWMSSKLGGTDGISG